MPTHSTPWGSVLYPGEVIAQPSETPTHLPGMIEQLRHLPTPTIWGSFPPTPGVIDQYSEIPTYSQPLEFLHSSPWGMKQPSEKLIHPIPYPIRHMVKNAWYNMVILAARGLICLSLR